MVDHRFPAPRGAQMELARFGFALIAVAVVAFSAPVAIAAGETYGLPKPEKVTATQAETTELESETAALVDQMKSSSIPSAGTVP